MAQQDLRSSENYTDDRTWSRRKLLKSGTTAAAIGLTTLAGCTDEDLEDSGESKTGGGGTISGMGPPSLDPSAYAELFDRVVVATDVGADPTGEQAIDSILNAELQPGTLLHFPEGIYKMNSGFRATGRSGNLGVTGDHAVIRHGEVESIGGHVVEDGEYSGGTMMFRIGTSVQPHHGNLVFGGLIFDWAWHDNAGMQGLNAFIDGQAEIRNIRFHGVHSLGTHGNMRVATASPDSFAFVEGIDMSGGGLHYADTINSRKTERYDGTTQEVNGREVGQSWSTTGLTGHPDQEGTAVFQNIVSGPWPGSPIYVRGGTGRKIVSECVVANGGGNQIRVNGGNDWDPIPWLDDTTDWDTARNGLYGQTTVENCLCWVEHTPEGVHQVQRGILLQDGPQTVRNCEIELGFAQGGGAGGMYGVGTRGEAGPVVIENCTITLHETTDAIYVSPYSGSVEVRDVEINTVGWDPRSSGALLGGEAPQIEQLTVNTIST